MIMIEPPIVDPLDPAMPEKNGHSAGRTAIIVWTLASVTTVVSLFLALSDGRSAPVLLGLLPVCVIMAVGSFKAWLILRFYLGLGRQAGSWRGLFIAFLIVIFAGVLAAQAAVVLMNT